MQDDEEENVAITYLVPHGDLRLVLNCSIKQKKRTEGSDVPKVSQRTLVVSSAVMRIASPVWNRMFDPKCGFMEAYQSSANQEVYLPDDNAEAMLLVLQIAHLLFKNVPQTLEFDQLLNVAILCDKYDTVGLIRPWLPKWEGKLKPLAYAAGYEDYLFISWAFGDYYTYGGLARKLVHTSKSNAAGQLISPTRGLLEFKMPPCAVGQSKLPFLV
jgi:hypothetical protein